MTPALTTSALAIAMPTMSGTLRSSDSSMSDSTVIVGTSSTVISSAVEASLAVPRVEESEVCTWSAVLEVGTAMVAVMRTLAAVTRIMTSDLYTPAASATFCCKLDMSLSEKSLTLPLTVSVSTTVSVEGGGDGVGGEGGGGGGGEGGGDEGDGGGGDEGDEDGGGGSEVGEGGGEGDGGDGDGGEGDGGGEGGEGGGEGDGGDGDGGGLGDGDVTPIAAGGGGDGSGGGGSGGDGGGLPASDSTHVTLQVVSSSVGQLAADAVYWLKLAAA